MTPETPAQNWRGLLLAVCVAQAAAIIGFDFTVPFIPLYLQHNLGVHGLAQTAMWAGIIGFGPAIPATIFGPLWGKLADRFGYRAMLIRAMAAAAVILSLMGLAGSPWMLFALRMLQGALTGTVFSAQALVAASVPERETARSMGLLQMSVFIGGTLGPVGGGAAAGALGFRPTYVGAGVMLGLATLLVVLFVREPRHRVGARAASTERPPSMWSVLTIPAFSLALVLTLAVQLASTSLVPVIPLYVQQLVRAVGQVPQATGWLMAVTGLAAGAGSYLTGRMHRQFPLKWMIIVCLLLSACLIAPQSLAHSYLELVAIRAAGAVAFGALLGLVSALAAVSSPPNARGAAFGLMGAASSLGFGCGPLLGGAIVAATGIRSAFIVSAALLVVAPPVLMAVIRLIPALLRVPSLPQAAPEQGD